MNSVYNPQNWFHNPLISPNPWFGRCQHHCTQEISWEQQQQKNPHLNQMGGSKRVLRELHISWEIKYTHNKENRVWCTFFLKQSFLKDFIIIYDCYYYYFLDKGERIGKDSKTSMCGCLSCAPYWGPGLYPRHVPWLGIELVTLWLTDWHSIHWASPARAEFGVLYTEKQVSKRNCNETACEWVIEWMKE